MKKLNIHINKKIVFEFISITFAVFLGLMLNQWQDNHNNRKLANQSLANLKNEIISNNSKIEKMLESHKLLQIKIDSLINTNTKIAYSNLKLNLNMQFLSSTSWETAKLTQAIAHMDIDVVTNIAGVYEFQNYYSNFVKQYIQDNIYNNPNTNENEKLRLIKSLLKTAISLESDLNKIYKQTLTEIFAE